MIYNIIYVFYNRFNCDWIDSTVESVQIGSMGSTGSNGPTGSIGLKWGVL
jgi:hypothetical protein